MKKKKAKIPPFILILMILLMIIVVVSMFSHSIFQVDMSVISLRDRMIKPSILGYDTDHLLGTDYMGRDVGIRILYATKTSLTIAFLGLIGSIILGTSLGIIGGLCGGRIDDFIVFLINVRISIPAIVIGIVAATIFGTGTSLLIFLIAIIYWTNFARIVRAEVMHIKNENYIECSKSIGSSSIRIIFEHVLVNIASPLIVTASMNISNIILFESSLSFLGLGVVPPQTSLGLMVSTGRDQMIGNTWLAIFPIIMIVFIVMAISLIGDWLRDKLDPKLRNRN